MELNIMPLNLSRALAKALQNDYTKFYHKIIRPKMKFGVPQVDKYGRIKWRTTFEPCRMLKDKQRQINSRIQALPLPSSMFGGIPGANNILNAYQHRNSCYYLNIDLKNFFERISNKQVNQALRNYGFSWEESRLITKFTTFKGSLPQGAPSSTTLANLVFSPIAISLEKLCQEKGIIFTNFVDDLTFSANKDFEYLIPQILDILKQNGFCANQRKIHYKHGSCEVTGLIVKKGQLHLCDAMLARMDNPGIKAYADNVAKYNATLEIAA
jgi:RNA-directed DNA polymerase